MTLIRRSPLTHAGFDTPAFTGYTDTAGYKTRDTPKYWPFGMKIRVPSKAKPKVKRKITGLEIEDNETL